MALLAKITEIKRGGTRLLAGKQSPLTSIINKHRAIKLGHPVVFNTAEAVKDPSLPKRWLPFGAEPTEAELETAKYGNISKAFDVLKKTVDSGTDMYKQQQEEKRSTNALAAQARQAELAQQQLETARQSAKQQEATLAATQRAQAIRMQAAQASQDAQAAQAAQAADEEAAKKKQMIIIASAVGGVVVIGIAAFFLMRKK